MYKKKVFLLCTPPTVRCIYTKENINQPIWDNTECVSCVRHNKGVSKKKKHMKAKQQSVTRNEVVKVQYILFSFRKVPNWKIEEQKKKEEKKRKEEYVTL